MPQNDQTLTEFYAQREAKVSLLDATLALGEKNVGYSPTPGPHKEARGQGEGFIMGWRTAVKGGRPSPGGTRTLLFSPEPPNKGPTYRLPQSPTLFFLIP